jgi:hypothetical protein
MPIFKTSGIKKGELCLFDVRQQKIKLRYKIICDFYRIRPICGKNKLKKRNNYSKLRSEPGMAFAFK